MIYTGRQYSLARSIVLHYLQPSFHIEKSSFTIRHCVRKVKLDVERLRLLGVPTSRIVVGVYLLKGIY